MAQPIHHLGSQVAQHSCQANAFVIGMLGLHIKDGKASAPYSE